MGVHAVTADRIAKILDSASVKPAPVGQKLTIRGWVRTKRDSKGGFSFLEINDGSCLKGLQVIAAQTLPNYETDVRRLTTGCSVQVSGELVESKGAQQSVELVADSVVVIGAADDSYPLQKKQHSMEFLRTIAHLRSRTNTFGAVARIRSTMAQVIHAFFKQEGFCYLHTPIITSSDCEGAGELFQVTTLDLQRPPQNDRHEVDYDQDFFGRRTGLTVSGQLAGEAYALALGKIYTFGPTFRAENSNTARHLAEFWMIEPEMAFTDLDGNAQFAERFLKEVLRVTLNECRTDIAFLNSRNNVDTIALLGHIIDTPFGRITYTDAVELLHKSGVTFEYPVVWGSSLQTEHERYLTEKVFKKPLIVTDYPKDIAAFYMRLNEDGKTVRNMDILVPGVGEIVGGSQREERYDVLRARMQERGMNLDEYSWYLDLRKYGTAPHSGFGVGFERMILFATGMENIRDVIPFPRAPRHAEF